MRIFHEAKALFDTHRISDAAALQIRRRPGGPDERALHDPEGRDARWRRPGASSACVSAISRQADTGVLDMVFDSYLAHNSREPIAFLDWVDRHYDDKAIGQRFKAKSWANLVVNKMIAARIAAHARDQGRPQIECRRQIDQRRTG